MNTRAYAVLEARKPLVPFEFDRREVGANDVALDIAYSGICHSDIHQAREEWGPAIFPMVPGHEIAGTVTAIGASVTKFKVGDKIGIGVFDRHRRREHLGLLDLAIIAGRIICAYRNADAFIIVGDIV